MRRDGQVRLLQHVPGAVVRVLRPAIQRIHDRRDEIASCLRSVTVVRAKGVPKASGVASDVVIADKVYVTGGSEIFRAKCTATRARKSPMA
jgi:hypothetical protein